jgi:putative two-component system hydrogenase maturation factor HypX/HoxX
LGERLLGKKRRRVADEAAKPLAAYRDEELAHMRRNFFEPDESYHELRGNFVYGTSPMVTPAYLLG